jgi:UDPglucose 6-dehydrogenase
VRATQPELIAEQDLVKAATGADAIVLATEWSQYREGHVPADLAPVVANKLIIDGRNALKVDKWQKAGFRLIALGRNVEA